MGITEAYKALKDIKHRLSDNGKTLEVMEAKENHVMVCKGGTCFEFFKPEKQDKIYVVPVVKWQGSGSKFRSVEKKYIALADLNHYMNATSFRDFSEKVRKIKDVEEDERRLLKLYDYVMNLFI